MFQSKLISLDDIMVGINRYIDQKRAEIGDVRVELPICTKHTSLTILESFSF